MSRTLDIHESRTPVNPDGAGIAGCHLPQLRHRPRQLARHLRVLGIGLPEATAAVVLASVFITGLDKLALLFAYSLVSNTLVAIVPHEPGMIYFGKLYPPALVAAVAGLGTMVASFIDFHLLGRVVHARPFRGLYRRRFYDRVGRYFRQYPTPTLALSGFLPVPYSPFKLMAISSGCSEKQYIFSVLLGRVPRFYLLALVGKTWKLSNQAIVAILGGLVVFAAVSFVRQLLRKNGNNNSVGATSKNSGNLNAHPQSSDER